MSPSPSPPPIPIPIPATPGRRATALQTLFTDALKHSTKTINYENFASCFPTPARHCPGFMYKLWSQLIAAFEARAQAEFESILQERAIVANLNGLDDLIAEARRRKNRAPASSLASTVPPHTLPPSALLAAHLQPHLTHTQSHLNAALQTIQSQNAGLALAVQAQRAEIEELLRRVEGVVGDLEGAVGGLGEGVVVKGLVEDVQRLDEEVKGSL
ncbi:MAG: hypothetical protein M1840_001671 [Geoglossum simile]|nr:MAG: hypothetical protein M1840_001671 [Geoglossum simile]